jgi:hypothetical protein
MPGRKPAVTLGQPEFPDGGVPDATKAREGINPFTKQSQTFAAKPASKSVRARPIKAIKDAVA